MDHLHKVLQDNHYPTQFFQQGKLQQKASKKPNPSRIWSMVSMCVVLCLFLDNSDSPSIVEQ